MSRLTVKDLDKVAYSPWELCGMDSDCTRDCRGCPVNAIYLKLAHYEDLEEQGRLIELPCKVGDYVYDIGDGTAYKTKVLQFVMFEDHLACRTVSSFPNVEAFGTRVFLTEAEAEEALMKMGGVSDDL